MAGGRESVSGEGDGGEGEGVSGVLGWREAVMGRGEAARGEEGRTAYCWFFVFLKVVVDEAED